MNGDPGLDELVRAGTRLSHAFDIDALISVLVEQAIDVTHSDLACLYLHAEPDEPASPLRLVYRRGAAGPPTMLDPSAEWVAFVHECGQATVLHERQQGPFDGLLLLDGMHSGIVLPLFTPTAQLGLLVVNARERAFYGRRRFFFLDSFAKLAAGSLHNARLFRELKEFLARIEALERYQANIFSSMTNLLVTTDRQGHLRYFNDAAAERLGLEDAQVGQPLGDLWHEAMDGGILEAIDRARTGGEELLGVEGIFRAPGQDMDFALNVSPLSAPDIEDGVTLVFTDQSREKDLQSRVDVVVEERRVIKDMFSRYVSADVIQTLMDQPDLIKPGGEKKEATVLFADIRGYTSFSEGRDPGVIVRILNAYFTRAVQIIIEHGGFIDKFIGDAIMAAWGIPMSKDGSETERAVRAALEIQSLIASRRRGFFTGVARNLRVGIGMHTGPLVAGNLGSQQRMDYTVIGDTVNIAARLEGVAGPGEVIITDRTRDRLSNRFVLKELEPVSVKGKSKPIPIFSVLGYTDA